VPSAGHARRFTPPARCLHVDHDLSDGSGAEPFDLPRTAAREHRITEWRLRTMSLLAELRRRNVIRVAGLYLVAAWLLVQVAETLLPIFDTPGWVLKVLVAMLAVGFIPAVVLAWVFELTPDGLRRESAIQDTQPTVDPTARRLDIAVIALLLLAIGLFVIGQRHPAPETASRSPTAINALDSAPPRSIAVLAFADLSADKDQEYFADGIAEELLNLLARIDGLQVAARTSSFKFKGGQADIGEIGRALGVETVLEGSVRKAGDQVRITAQLIRVENGFHLWTQSYDRRLENLFATQDEIASAIVDALKLELDLSAETSGRTHDLAAYDLFLRGRHEARAPSQAALLRAISLWEQALAIDPEYAAALSGIAEAWVWLEDYGGVKSSEAYPKAEQAARRALAIDPDSPEANTAMAMLQDRYYSDATRAQALFERTLAINPNYVPAYTLYADALRDLGKPRRMIEVQRRAVELDPLSPFYRARLASRYIDIGAHAEVEHQLETLLADHPGNDYALEERGNLRMQQKRWADAAADFRQVHLARPGDPYAATQLAMLGLTLELSAMTDAWLAEARARGADNRWELRAREEIAIVRGDWQELASVGAKRGGARGSGLQGLAQIGLSQLPEARRTLNDALRLGGYRRGEATHFDNVAPLLRLAWIGRQEGSTDWAEHAEPAERLLQAIEAEGAMIIDSFSTPLALAQLAAVRGDRDGALAELRRAEDRFILLPWFLDSDPLLAAYRTDPAFRAIVERQRAHAVGERERVIAAGLDRP
jgi:TolB-like protein/Tfp pilus assembly protein PilF